MNEEILADPGAFLSAHFQDEGFKRELGEAEVKLGRELLEHNPNVRGFVDLRARKADLEGQLSDVTTQMQPLQRDYDAALAGFMAKKSAGSADEYVRKQFANRIAHVALASLDNSATVLKAREGFAHVDAKTLQSFKEKKEQIPQLRKSTREYVLDAFAQALKLGENGDAKERAFRQFMHEDFVFDDQAVYSFAGIAKIHGSPAVYVFSPTSKNAGVLGEDLSIKLAEFGNRGLPHVAGLPGMDQKQGIVKFGWDERPTMAGFPVGIFTPKYVAGLASGDKPVLNDSEKEVVAEAALKRLTEVNNGEDGFQRFVNAHLQYRVVPIPKPFWHFTVARLLGEKRDEILKPEYAPRTTITRPELPGHSFTKYDSVASAEQEARGRIRVLGDVRGGLTKSQLANVLATPETAVITYGIPVEGNTSSRRYSLADVEAFLKTHSYTQTARERKQGQRSFRWVPKESKH